MRVVALNIRVSISFNQILATTTVLPSTFGRQLFENITEREERASIATATDLPFSEWGTVFPDHRLVAAIVDRVTSNAHIL